MKVVGRAPCGPEKLSITTITGDDVWGNNVPTYRQRTILPATVKTKRPITAHGTIKIISYYQVE